jgi:glycolate oxidase
MVLEYIDMITLGAITAHVGLELGIPEEIGATAPAYLVVMMEDMSDARLDEDVAALATLLTELGALDVYVLPGGAAAALIDAREKSFWVAKANHADDIVDIVVPRACLPELMDRVAAIAADTGSWIAGCGHAGDGNVHLSVFQADAEVRAQVLHELFATGMALGGAISGEHGIGRAKQRWFLELEDPAKLALRRRIKIAFDPRNILNPGTLLGRVDPEGAVTG